MVLQLILLGLTLPLAALGTTSTMYFPLTIAWLVWLAYLIVKASL